MKRNCPNLHCQNYKNSQFIIKAGTFKRKDDSRIIQRFKCKICNVRFCTSTGRLEYRQNKRRVNYQLYKLLCSGVSMRRSAILLNIHRTTVKRKLYYLGEKARLKNKKLNDKLKESKVTHLQIDDLITKENSKLKPLSVSIAVDADRRYILGAVVSKIPAFGHLAKEGKKKYPRKCDHKNGLEQLFTELKDVVHPNAMIYSDEHKKYPEFVSKYFSKAQHERFKSERGCVAGLGELKKVRFDPLFAINHTCAMLRANINRLVRKTWCTTKDPRRLQDHLDIFISFYNNEYLKMRGITPI